MKKKRVTLLVILLALLALFCSLGIGPYRSGAAAYDLTEQLTAIHGEPYSVETENGTETLEFTIEPDSFFLTDWNLRRFFGWDYHYTCTVTYTAISNDGSISQRVTTYKAVDPMGYDEADVGAYIDVESAVTKGRTVQP